MATNQTDSVFDALSNQTRISVILVLYEEPCGVSLSELIDKMPDDIDEVALQHRHLPKLHERGFIDWNTGDNFIARGRQWGNIESVVTSLHYSGDTFDIE